MFAAIDTAGLTDADRARFAFLRASNILWALSDPARAKEVIDEAARTTTLQSCSYIDAFRTVYWFATDQPEVAARASENLAVEQLPLVVGTEIAWVLAAIAADAGRTTDAVAVAELGFTVATRSLDAPQMMFNIADAYISALLLSGRIGDALDVADRVGQQAADLPGPLNCSVLPLRDGPLSAPAGSTARDSCWSRPQSGCPHRVMPSAGDIAIRCHA